MKGSITLKCNMLIYISVTADQRIFKHKPIKARFNLHLYWFNSYIIRTVSEKKNQSILF